MAISGADRSENTFKREYPKYAKCTGYTTHRNRDGRTSQILFLERDELVKASRIGMTADAGFPLEGWSWVNQCFRILPAECAQLIRTNIRVQHCLAPIIELAPRHSRLGPICLANRKRPRKDPIAPVT